MRVLMINVVCGIRSTGRICTDIANELEALGHEVKIAYGREHVPGECQRYAVRIGSDFDVMLHGVRARLFDGCGWGSKRATKRFIDWIDRYDPDVIHLHNLHGYYINIETLFGYLKNCGRKIIWTLHDCWGFTGHAAYCEGANCQRWVNGCDKCPNKKEYPKSLTDYSRRNWTKKKDLFHGFENLTIVTPSEWLAELVKMSFLNKYPVLIIPNGVDTNVFKPMNCKNLKDSLKIGEKKVILGVASIWDNRKGLKDFFSLREKLTDDYVIILVGLSSKQISSLPEGIIGITRTNSTKELAEFYNLADFFINPTYEDNYPTVNLESIACGTTVLTYNTGGSPESANLYGCSVEKGNVDQLIEKIKMYEKQVNTIIPNTSMLSNKHMIKEYLRIIC